MLIQNSVARTVFNTLKTCHITPLLASPHWLKIKERIEYKLLSLTYKILTTSQSTYLHNLVSLQSPRGTRSSSVAGATPLGGGALGGHAPHWNLVPSPQMKRELQWKNWLNRASLLAVKLWLWTVIAAVVVVPFVQCQWTLHSIDHPSSTVYTLQVNNSKKSYPRELHAAYWLGPIYCWIRQKQSQTASFLMSANSFLNCWQHQTNFVHVLILASCDIASFS